MQKSSDQVNVPQLNKVSLSGDSDSYLLTDTATEYQRGYFDEFATGYQTGATDNGYSEPENHVDVFKQAARELLNEFFSSYTNNSATVSKVISVSGNMLNHVETWVQLAIERIVLRRIQTMLQVLKLVLKLVKEITMQ